MYPRKLNELIEMFRILPGVGIKTAERYALIMLEQSQETIDDFAKALSLCDHVIVTDIYAAREKDTGIVSSKDIVDRMADYDVDVHYIKKFDDIEKFILKNCKKNDLLITMGAGNVDSIGNSLVNR